MSTFLTAEEVADRLRVEPTTVREWLRQGELIGIKIGNGWRINESDIDRYLEDRRFEVLLERVKRKYPDRNWERGLCRSCQQAIPVPNDQSSWVCSPKCKKEHDEYLEALVGRGGPQADVVPF